MDIKNIANIFIENNNTLIDKEISNLKETNDLSTEDLSIIISLMYLSVTTLQENASISFMFKNYLIEYYFSHINIIKEIYNNFYNDEEIRITFNLEKDFI